MACLARLHSFGLNAHCEKLITLDSLDKLDTIRQLSQPYFVLGEGSNTAFVSNYAGNIVLNRLKGVHYVETKHCHAITVAGGENWHEFVTYCMQNGWYGLENLALIPGTVGAAPIQNIGAYGVEVAQFVETVTAYDMKTGEKRIFSQPECTFAYRDSYFKQNPNWFIASVEFRLPKKNELELSYRALAEKNPTSAELLYQAVVAIRREKLPDHEKIGNAGSFFKNPLVATQKWQVLREQFPTMPCFSANLGRVKVPAAWLIEHLGFKHKHNGGIRCYVNQPLVLINDGTGTGSELLAFAREIRQEVDIAFGIQLEAEARLIGENGLVQL